MSAAREEILGRVRRTLADAPAAGPVPRAYRRVGALPAPARVALLEERLLDYGARVERAAPADVAAAIARATAGARIAVPAGLPPEWLPAGAVEDRGLTPTELDALDGALTGCILAIAETGTLVLGGGSDGRRALTLVPDLHVCIVHAEQVVETVPEALARLAPDIRRPLTLVSGPSATSDIELSRVEGVHGPRRLVVVIVE